jgi:glyoxylase-like metal-dependent hydrolase (beta-lactamase superfamily II)
MNGQFSRRVFLRSIVLAAAAIALPLTLHKSLVAQTIESLQSSGNSGIYRFKLGSFELISLSDGVLEVPAALFAGNATAEQLTAVLKEGFQSEKLTPDCNILYVNTGKNKVLIDTGSGSFAPAKTVGKLLATLEEAQINPNEIDTIIITHAHGDHIGGLVDRTGKSAFSNARFYISRSEHDFWTQPNVSLPKIKIDPEAQQKMISTAQQQLKAIRDRLTLFDVDREIIPGITAIAASGHTPGQVALRITSGEMSMTHTADVVHIHTINLWNPDWQPVFDADPTEAVNTRKQILGKIASDRELMFAYHFPFPGIGHIRPRTEGGFSWESVNWQV